MFSWYEVTLLCFVSAAMSQSLALYREEAQDLLRRMGLSTPDEAGSSGDEAKIIPDEGVEALSAAMALLGGAEAGVGGEVRWVLYGIGRLAKTTCHDPRWQRRVNA